jgi:uncharacterized protein
VIFYVEVSNVEAALQKAESLGGIRRMGPVAAPSGLVMGQFADPDGVMGVARNGVGAGWAQTDPSRRA